MSPNIEPSFSELGLSDAILGRLKALSFETPTAVQAQTIPLMSHGHDVAVQAQTGTGKTAAFALPILQNIRCQQQSLQCLVLAPTRELAIQVADAFKQFGSNTPGLKVAAIYGNDDYRRQIRALTEGVQVVVGTPGRVMDHMRRGTLRLDNLTHLVLDEADEMLRVGFLEDIQWILSQAPEKKQTALFSATMPKHIRKIATQYLKNMREVTIKTKTATVDRIRQRYLVTKESNKFDVLKRILEAETWDGIIIFSRTRTSTVELCERLRKLGKKAEPLNGDIAQVVRKRTVERLKSGAIDIIVATDVAARGLDIERISCVINYDMPFDNETYVHRIGRTGRAGRKGDAILFVNPRDQRLLQGLERSIKVSLEKMSVPSSRVINRKRIVAFKETVCHTASQHDTHFYKELLTELADNTSMDMLDIAAALAHLTQGNTPLLLNDKTPLGAEFIDQARKPKKKKFRFEKKLSSKEKDKQHKRRNTKSKRKKRA